MEEEEEEEEEEVRGEAELRGLLIDIACCDARCVRTYERGVRRRRRRRRRRKVYSRLTQWTRRTPSATALPRE